MQAYTNLDGYELFRKAIVDRDELAWAETTSRYRAMLISWASRSSASRATIERCDDIADYAFERAWTALTPERFERFETLASLLAYLRSCVASAVIDCARSDTNFERIYQIVEADDVSTPEDIIVDQSKRAEVWQTAKNITQSPQELAVLIDTFVFDLPPRAILARHPDLFDDADTIYIAKRNLLERLRRNPEMQRIHLEWDVV